MSQQFPWGHSKPYNDYSSYYKQKFNVRVQKISVNAGFSCPNRDGKAGAGGCTYCNNISFSPFYCHATKSISQQINEGIEFFAKKYQTMKFMAYFQSFSNTYAPVEQLKECYTEALSHPKVIGLVVATRPDCVSDEVMHLLQEISNTHFVSLEYGIESTLDTTLMRINRGHTYHQTLQAIDLAYKFGIPVGIHMILGLPGETRDDFLMHARKISILPVETLKLHQLQILKNTSIAHEFENHPLDFIHFTVDEYIELVIDFLEWLNPHIIVERFISESPVEMIISPQWNKIKNFEFVSRLEKRMVQRNTWQGKKFITT